MAIDIDISAKEWKKLDLPNRFPQTFIISNDLTPLYFETGENSDELSEFFISLNRKNKEHNDDIDEDDVIKINKLKNKIFKAINKDDFQHNKHYLINVSVNKMFDCGPCTEQKEYVEILKLDDFNIINIHLI
jgi:hypothetical protein